MGEDRYLDGTYLSQNPTWHADDSDWKVEKLLGMIERNRLTPQSVCEVGCGAGRVIDGLARELAECEIFVGIDPAPDALKLCEDLVGSPVEFRLQDPFDGGLGPYDLVLAIDVIEHVQDYLGFLYALRPTAEYKIFHVPLDLSVQAALRPTSFTSVRQSLGHLHYFTRELALAALAETGYRVLDVEFTRGATELRSSTLRRQVARLPRRAAAIFSTAISARLFGGFSLLILAQ